jgi:hypothetical protein
VLPYDIDIHPNAPPIAMLPPKLLFFFFRTSSAQHRSSLFLL